MMSDCSNSTDDAMQAAIGRAVAKMTPFPFVKVLDVMRHTKSVDFALRAIDWGLRYNIDPIDAVRAIEQSARGHAPAAESRPEPACSSFDVWWHEKGSAIVPHADDDMEEHARRVAEIAWIAGGQARAAENRLDSVVGVGRRGETMGKDTGKPPIGEAFETGNEIVILGTPPEFPDSVPEEDPRRHNCDVMGCGCAHVLYRFRKPTT